MNILVLSGSPRKGGNTDLLVESFVKGASQKHQVEVVSVHDYKVNPCIGCNSCFAREDHKCCQKDDMQSIYTEILSSDMVVFASPIYYFTLSAQLQAAIHRTYSIDIPKNIKKVALIMSSGSPFVYGPAITQYYQSIVEYWGVENAGIFTANGEQNKSREKRDELYGFGKSLKN